MNKPCLTCGTPATGSHCPDHEPTPWRHPDGSARARGYSTAWDRLSKRARSMQPFCSDCGAVEDLQLDHTPATWQRIAAGRTVRLKDTGGVVCGPCNRRRGSGRERQGGGPVSTAPGPLGKPQGPSLSGDRA